MNKLIFLALFASQIVFCQENHPTTTYKNGHNGMELIVAFKKHTVVVSTFNSKPNLKEDIAQKVYDLFKENKFKTGESICVDGAEAKVTGKCFITKKGDLISVNFYYDKIEWNNGTIEIHEERI
jgi:hypothetical protein